MPSEIAPIFDYFQPLQLAVNEIANIWRPAATPVVSAEERAKELADRAHGCQRRRIR